MMKGAASRGGGLRIEPPYVVGQSHWFCCRFSRTAGGHRVRKSDVRWIPGRRAHELLHCHGEMLSVW